ncbi:ankyrin [Rhizoclosmatium globosum]|uniref:Ankyrin n=1 Tax=Rhizoclosmatium globosum TaxID=329046 RepID=A0A1Y2CJY7_9FUNG|nr:ankyrin [Rhizoclosmatium globosum]|eukprot:ORY47331.1 ankyrin [Rhizoclosmatium globosum]
MPAWHFYFWRRVGELKFAALPVSYTAALLRLAGLNRRSLSACGVKTQRTSNILLIEWRKDSFARNKAHIEKALLQLVAEKESFRNWIETECDHSLLLVWACAAGSMDIVYFIKENHWKETQEAHTLAMVTSAGCGHINILRYLIENCGIDPSASNNEAFEWAAKSGHLEVVEYLLADERTDPSAVSSMPLVWACKFGHLAVVDRLLKDGRSDPSAQEHSGLLSAARAGYTHIVKLLLQDERVNVNAQNAHALLYSTCHGHAETLNVLLKAGADASLQNYCHSTSPFKLVMPEQFKYLLGIRKHPYRNLDAPVRPCIRSCQENRAISLAFDADLMNML